MRYRADLPFIKPYWFLPRARCYASMVYRICCHRVSVRPSVCLSVCHKSVFYQDAKPRITQTTPYDKIPTGSPPTCQNTQLFTWHLPLFWKSWLHRWRTSYLSGFSGQITSLPKACYYITFVNFAVSGTSIRQLPVPLLPLSSTANWIAVILYYKLPKCQLYSLQQIQNSLARIAVVKALRSCHITSTLRSLQSPLAHRGVTRSNKVGWTIRGGLWAGVSRPSPSG